MRNRSAVLAAVGITFVLHATLQWISWIVADSVAEARCTNPPFRAGDRLTGSSFDFRVRPDCQGVLKRVEIHSVIEARPRSSICLRISLTSG